ncbi:MAG TPA: Pr6Pr family membrane protein, partial [Flavisolibacter sp.]
IKEETKDSSQNRKRYAMIGAVTAWVAVLLQLYLMLQNRTETVGETLIRFFSFFTILTNILVAVCLTSVVVRHKKMEGFFSSPITLSAVTVYILIVGLVYNLVLRSTWSPQGLQMLVDELLHAVIPVFVFVFWLLFVRKDELKGGIVYRWLLFPFAYLIFILLRGSSSGFYPYPFINVPVIGYTKVINNTLILMGVFLLFSFLLVGLAKLLLRKQRIRE